ncbi:hypothetical protein QBC34DRAFT_426004 [Podospora aff. communis PSN243]|uniref:Uncharacterized protein n=1 Tax=Podospora aff. communis PSN243 TaxID=3040156 RepID=A0AAV9GNK6_9PEZI|nr:hypothetical protein QBC34DRAFT_426004 [Podospora aff. communis PSN243]
MIGAGPLLIVHLFVNHDPFLASVFLPNLSSHFPDTAWRLPPLIASPPRPAHATTPAPPIAAIGYDGRGLLGNAGAYAAALAAAPRPPIVHPRQGLGRCVLETPLPVSTTLEDLLAIIERDLDPSLASEFAAFTIFPQEPSRKNHGKRPQWHNTPLPLSMTLAEVRAADHDRDAPQSIPAKMQPHPELHLVLETRGAALARIVGTDFLFIELGKPFETYRDVWSRLESFNHAYYKDRWDSSDLRRSLSRWRHAKYALSYLHRQRRKQQRLVDQISNDAVMIQDLDGQIEKHERDKQNARGSISAWIRWWMSFVRIQDSAEGHRYFEGQELPDDRVEAAVQWVWWTKHEIIDEWKTSPRRNSLWNSLQKTYLERHPWQRNMTTDPVRRSITTTGPPSSSSSTPIVKHSAETSSVQTYPFRDAAGALLTNEQSTFVIASGVLLWGHIMPMYYGSLQETFTNNAATYVNMDPEPIGSPRQYSYTFRSAARNGRWKVRRYYSNWRDEKGQDRPPREHAGWVMFHQDVNATEVLKRLEGLTPTGSALSNHVYGNRHVDKDIRQIGRNDWSRLHHTSDPNSEREKFELRFQAVVQEALGPGQALNDDIGYFASTDAKQWGADYLRAYKHECEADKNATVERMFRPQAGGEAFGTYVRMKYTEMQFAWLIFSGRKHSQHDGDELVAIVYDGAYEVLEGSLHAVEPEP